MSVAFIVELRVKSVRLHAQGAPRGAGKSEIERAVAAIAAQFPQADVCEVKVRGPRGRMPFVEATAFLHSREDARAAASLAVDTIKAAHLYVAGTELFAGEWIAEMRSRGYACVSRNGTAPEPAPERADSSTDGAR